MSPKIQNSQVQETKPKAPRKPTLPAKYSKMLVFGYSLVESLRAKGIFSDELVDQVFNELHLMSSLDEQVSYYENVLSQAGANAKVMKKFIAAKNKPVKEPKVRKPRAKKSVTVQSDASDEDVIQNLVDAARDVAPKAKKPRKNAKKVDADEEPVVEAEVPVVEPKTKKPKAKKVDTPEVSTLVETTVEPKEKAKAKAEPKEKAKAEPKEKAKAEPKEKAKVEPKEKAKAEPKEKAKVEPKEKKTKAEPKAKVQPEPVVQDNADDDDDEEEILTKETSIDGVAFLIDQHNNLYNPVSHEFVRKL
jgi:hypothetical protein